MSRETRLRQRYWVTQRVVEWKSFGENNSSTREPHFMSVLRAGIWYLLNRLSPPWGYDRIRGGPVTALLNFSETPHQLYRHQENFLSKKHGQVDKNPECRMFSDILWEPKSIRYGRYTRFTQIHGGSHQGKDRRPQQQNIDLYVWSILLGTHQGVYLRPDGQKDYARASALHSARPSFQWARAS